VATPADNSGDGDIITTARTARHYHGSHIGDFITTARTARPRQPYPPPGSPDSLTTNGSTISYMPRGSPDGDRPSRHQRLMVFACGASNKPLAGTSRRRCRLRSTAIGRHAASGLRHRVIQTCRCSAPRRPGGKGLRVAELAATWNQRKRKRRDMPLQCAASAVTCQSCVRCGPRACAVGHVTWKPSAASWCTVNTCRHSAITDLAIITDLISRHGSHHPSLVQLSITNLVIHH
jgi:hypothetical protein